MTLGQPRPASDVHHVRLCAERHQITGCQLHAVGIDLLAMHKLSSPVHPCRRRRIPTASTRLATVIDSPRTVHSVCNSREPGRVPRDEAPVGRGARTIDSLSVPDDFPCRRQSGGPPEQHILYNRRPSVEESRSPDQKYLPCSHQVQYLNILTSH